MDLLTSMKISSSGLKANRKRMEAISSNIANAQTTRTVEGGPYRRKEVVFGSALFACASPFLVTVECRSTIGAAVGSIIAIIISHHIQNISSA